MPATPPTCGDIVSDSRFPPLIDGAHRRVDSAASGMSETGRVISSKRSRARRDRDRAAGALVHLGNPHPDGEQGKGRRHDRGRRSADRWRSYRPHCPRSPETAQSRDGGARNLAADTRPLGGGGEGCVFHVKRNEAKVTDRDIRIAKRRGSRRWIREPRRGDASVDQSLMTTTRREGSAPSLSLETPSTFATAS